MTENNMKQPSLTKIVNPQSTKRPNNKYKKETTQEEGQQSFVHLKTHENK